MSVKISELPILDSLADNDVIAGVDTSANVTSKIEMATLKNYIDTNTQYTAGTNIDITNNVVSAPNVYNKTETDELLEEKDEQIEELQSEVDSLSTIFNAFPTESGEGESLTLDDTAEVKFKKFDLKGNTSQTTYSGKNLLPNNGITETKNGITFTKNEDNTITLNGTATADTYANVWYSETNNLINDTNQVYTMSIGLSNSNVGLAIFERINNNWSNIKYAYAETSTYTPSGNQTGQLFRVIVKNGAVLNNVIVKPMLVKGTTVGEYEPYVGGTPSPNPSYPQPINVVSGDNEIVINSKNQLETYNISGTFNGVSYTLQDGVLTLNGTCTSTNGLAGLGIFRQSKGINYKWTYVYESGSCTDYGGGLYMGATPTSISSAGYGAGFRTNQSRTVDTFNNNEEHTYYLYMAMNNNSTYTNYKIKPLIVQGDEYSYDFEPYQGNTYNIDLPEGMELCKIGTYQDYFYKDSDKWYLHKANLKATFNGTETGWSTRTTGGSWVLYELSVSSYGFYNTTTLDLGYCNQYISKQSLNTNNSFRIQSGSMLSVRNDTIGSLDNFKNSLSTNNLIIYFPLATPTTTEITYQPLIDQLNLLEKAMSKDSQTNISQVNNDLGFIIYAEAIMSLQNVLDRIELLES